MKVEKTVYDLCLEVGLQISSEAQKQALSARTVRVERGTGYLPGLGSWHVPPQGSFLRRYYDPKPSGVYQRAIEVRSYTQPDDIERIHHFLEDGTVKSHVMI